MIRIPSWSERPPGRGAAFLIHLFVSLLAFSTLVAMMLLYWFPGELFFVDGGWEGLKLVAMVDLVLGPALTLILYKPGKPRLVMDLSIIAGIQLAALVYGFYTTHSQRTVAVVYAENYFATVSARDHLAANEQLKALDRSPQQVAGARLLNVPVFMTPPPENYGEFLQEILNGYPEPRERSDLYIPIDQGRAQMTGGQQNLQQLDSNGMLDVVKASLTRRDLHIDEVEVYTFKARYASGLVLFDPDQLRIIDYLPFPATPGENQSVAEADE
jgi:hypothetical protein